MSRGKECWAGGRETKSVVVLRGLQENKPLKKTRGGLEAVFTHNHGTASKVHPS